MADESRKTTAEWIGAFQRELEAEGIEPDNVTYMVQVAGRELIQSEGLYVKEVGRDG
ncbi:hypothetical protein [Streptomyces bullii]|uniref:PH domain-containing protein n=1 Tax=Streptomyces bullii TaxID=349910 RepID=A0ABW0UP73_9ACTN